MYLSYDKTSTYDLGSGKAEILDIRTPRHGKFAARYKRYATMCIIILASALYFSWVHNITYRSHSYTIMNEIVPEILENVIMDLTDNKAQYEKKYGGETASEDILWAIRKIKRLKFRVQNDNKFKPFLGLEPDRELWNDFLSKLPPRQNTFYSACCLYAECFVYRRVQSYFENSKALKEFDVYHKEKKKLLAENMTAVEALLQCSRSLTVSDEALIMLIRVWNCLEPEKILSWGLRCTPVVNVARVTKNSADPFVALREADKRTLINRSYKACSVINEVDRSKPVIIEILCEKCGYDLIADLVTADYFIMNKLANKVRFNVKPIPWNVADVTAKDIDWTLKFLREQQSVVLQEFARRWMGFLDDGKFEVAPPEYFWASPYEFYRMREVNNNLFETLSKAALIICKGDLNYRKLVGDFCWDFNEPLVTCIRGFAPSHILCLRVITSEALCGLSQDLVEGLYKKNKEWMSSGEYATVQYVEKNYCGCKKEEEDEEEVQIEPTSIVSLGEAGASSAKQ